METIENLLKRIQAVSPTLSINAREDQYIEAIRSVEAITLGEANAIAGAIKPRDAVFAARWLASAIEQKQAKPHTAEKILTRDTYPAKGINKPSACATPSR